MNTLILTLLLAAAPGPPQVKLEWKVKTQGDVYGCLVYRALRREGPFVRVSPAIVRVPEGEAGASQPLSFVDTSVERGKQYFYYLDVVRTSGAKERLSPVISKTVE